MTILRVIPFIKYGLLKFPTENNCLTLLTNLSIEANSVDPDQIY